jgi:hypothetical protein
MSKPDVQARPKYFSAGEVAAASELTTYGINEEQAD